MHFISINNNNTYWVRRPFRSSLPVAQADASLLLSQATRLQWCWFDAQSVKCLLFGAGERTASQKLELAVQRYGISLSNYDRRLFVAASTALESSMSSPWPLGGNFIAWSGPAPIWVGIASEAEQSDRSWDIGSGASGKYLLTKESAEWEAGKCGAADHGALY